MNHLVTYLLCYSQLDFYDCRTTMISDADDNVPPKLVGRTQRVLLELSTIFYFFARNAAIPVVQQYVYYLVARKYNLTDAEAAAAADVDEGLRPVTNSSSEDELMSEDQLQTATDGQLVCICYYCRYQALLDNFRISEREKKNEFFLSEWG